MNLSIYTSQDFNVSKFLVSDRARGMRMLRARGCWRGLRRLSGLSVHPSQSPRLHAIALAQSTATSLESSSPLRPIFSRTFASASGSFVITVKDDAEYVSALKLAQENNGVTVVCFTPRQHRDCNMIPSLLDRLSRKYTKVTFIKVHMDEEKLQGLVEKEKIIFMPTFRLYKGRKLYEELAGIEFEVPLLKTMIADLCES